MATQPRQINYNTVRSHIFTLLQDLFKKQQPTDEILMHNASALNPPCIQSDF